MGVLEGRSRYYSSPLEKRLREKFLPWIEETRGGNIEVHIDEMSNPEPEITTVNDPEHLR